MGKPGARKGDKITSQSTGDPHIALQPGPSGLVPVPQVISVSNSVIKEKVAKKVNVMGQPGAVKGSVSKHSPPHIPIPPAVKFQKEPSNKGEIVTGSANVFYEGKPAAMLGDTAKMCADPSDAPVGRVVGDAKQVNIGGGGKDKGGEEDADGAAKKAKKARCTPKAHVGSATKTGHPINVASGELIISGEDFDLDGPLPIQFVRTYLSTGAAEVGPLGYGWAHNLQERVERIEKGHPEWEMVDAIFAAGGDSAPDGRYLAHVDANGVPTHYQAPAEGEAVMDVLHETTLRYVTGVCELADRTGVTRRFEHLAGTASTLQLVSVVDRNGNTVRYRYDLEGRVIEIVDCYGRRLGVVYDEASRISAIRFRVSSSSPWAPWCSYRYDERGDLVEVGDRAGASCRFAYADHLVAQDVNRDGYSYFFQYDESRRCIRTWGQDGHLTRYLEYDRAGRRTRELNGEGEQTVYEYDEWDRVVRTEKGSDVEVELNLDDDGRLVSRRNGGATVTSIAYDGFGNTKSVTDGEGATTDFEHNAAGQVVSQTNALGETSSFAYDDRGNQVERTPADGSITRFERDDRGRVVRAIGADGSVAIRRYDDFGHLAEAGPLGATTSYEFDPLGNLLWAVSSEGVESRYEWDARGYLSREIVEGRTVGSFTYSPEGCVTEYLDGDGRPVRQSMGAPGVVVRKEIFDASEPARRAPLLTKHYDCDREGRIRSIKASNGASVSYTFDDAGRISSRRTSEGLHEQYRYDDAGLMCEIEDQSGGLQRIRYDGQARVTGIGHDDDSWDTLEYDLLGRMVAADNTAGCVEIEYGPGGRRQVERFADFELASEIDLERMRVASVAEGAYRRDDEFDARHGFVSLRLGPLAVEIERDASRRVAGRRFSNGTAERFAYDRHGRIERADLDTPTESHRRETEFERERISAVRDSLRGDRAYRYDGRGRLIDVDAERAETYHYDESDNLRSCHRFEDSALLDRLRLSRAGNAEYTHDDHGRVVRISRSGAAPLEIEYDVRGLVSLVRLPDGGEVRYVYDSLARRTRKQFRGGRDGGLEIRIDWRGDDPCREVWTRDGETEVEYTYLFENGAPLARVEQRGDAIRQLFFHNDHLGTPIACSDEGGEIIWRSEADAFGWSTDESAVPHAFRLPGQHYDFETGLCYNRWRTYDPWTGRYLQLDPVAPPIEESPYVYPLDPLRYVDPLGLTKALVVVYDSNESYAGRLSKAHGADVIHHSELAGMSGTRALSKYDHVIIDAHGHPDCITTSDASGKKTGPRWAGQVAHDLESAGFDGRDEEGNLKERQVTVAACRTGSKPDGFAAKLATNLGPGSEVSAWTGDIIVDESGEPRVVLPGPVQEFRYGNRVRQGRRPVDQPGIGKRTFSVDFPDE